MKRAALLLVSSLASCVSAADCGNAVPADLRADTYLYVLDKQLVKPVLMPRADQSLAFGAGQPFAGLSEERKKAVALQAAGYAACLRERVDRSK